MIGLKRTYTNLGFFGEYSQNLRNTDHFIQMYETSDHLGTSICDYIIPGLNKGEGIIIIATKPHIATFLKSLNSRGISITEALRKEQLVLLDASEALGLFMNNGLPDAVKFTMSIGAMIEEMKRKYKNIRAYGEMVNILWNQKNIQGAIQVERMWSDLSRSCSYTLLAGYQVETQTSEEKGGLDFQEICANSQSYIISPDGLLIKTEVVALPDSAKVQI